MKLYGNPAKSHGKYAKRQSLKTRRKEESKLAQIDLDNTNPLENLYEDFERIVKQTVIKYNTIAEAYETFETKALADQYMSALEGSDTFFSYNDYDVNDVYAAGLDYSQLLIEQVKTGDIMDISPQFRDALLKVHRQRVIDSFEEQNNYYRMLNGYPAVEITPNLYHYLSETMAKRFNIDPSIPIHEIQDHYNKITPGHGDYLIKSIEGLGVIDSLIELHPYDTYLPFVGSTRISIVEARTAKNFEILYMNQGALKTIVYDEFITIYEECRQYFMTVIYQVEHRKVITYYDNFIAMCIMLMAIWHLVMRAMPLGINREFFRDQGIRMLYEAYSVPYDMTIDEIQQKQIAQHLNLLIQWKATNSVLFDITDLLGFHRINIYKYYLVKERKFDIYGVPIVATEERFNNDTGVVETVPDYKAMYDLYFNKVDLKEDNFIESFYSNTNREDYERITTEDPFWWEDTKLFKELWENDYNFVESKYISLGLNYSMTEMMYECIMVLKMIMEFREEMASIVFTLPKIEPDLQVTLFDAVILLCCLVCKKHHLTGEIIAIPTQVLNVLEYMHDIDNQDFVVDAFGFDFDLLRPGNEEGEKVLREVMEALDEEDGEEEVKKFLSYLDILSIDGNATNEEKVRAFNQMFKNLRGLSDWISYKLSETHSRQVYDALRQFYRTAYYAKEMREIFTINSENPEMERTAFTYFEYLYYINPKLYSSLFKVDLQRQYDEYLVENELDGDEYTIEDFQYDVDYGNIQLDYSTLNTENEDIRVDENLLYYYIDHIIYKLSQYIEDIDMLYLRNDTETPLEKLLIRMVKFFKSFTVDFIGLDIILICDFKNENIMRMMDEVEYIRKLIEVHELYPMLLSDVIHALIVKVHHRDTLSLTDALMLNAYLRLINRDDNYLFTGDWVHTIESYLHIKDLEANRITLYDAMQTYVDLLLKDQTHDGISMRDKVVKTWLSD